MTTVLPVRTIAEAYMYLELVLEGDGPKDYSRLTRLRSVDDRHVLEVDGEYGGRHYRMTFVAPPPPPGEKHRGGGFYGYGDEPSKLIDAGGWRLIEDWCVPAIEDAERHLREDRPPGQADHRRIAEGLSTARGAVREIRKFIPPGADTVPVDAFFTPSGKEVYDFDPSAFRRERVDADEARYQRLTDEFVSRFVAGR